MLKQFTLALSFAVIALAANEALARDDCYAWGQARAIIAKEGLLATRDATQQVTDRYGGRLIGAKLCQRNGRYVYDITVLRGGGQVTEVTVNGHTGAHIRAVGGSGTAEAGAAGSTKGKLFKFKLPKFWKKN